jgi:hypothetical protein
MAATSRRSRLLLITVLGGYASLVRANSTSCASIVSFDPPHECKVQERSSIFTFAHNRVPFAVTGTLGQTLERGNMLEPYPKGGLVAFVALPLGHYPPRLHQRFGAMDWLRQILRSLILPNGPKKRF